MSHLLENGFQDFEDVELLGGILKTLKIFILKKRLKEPNLIRGLFLSSHSESIIPKIDVG